MPKSFRICSVLAGVVAVVLGLSQVALAGAPTKSSKKRKKKKTAITTVLFATIPRQTSISQPLTTNMVTAPDDGIVPVAPLATATERGVLRVARTPGIHILPTDTSPALTATAGQLLISEFRLFGPNGVTDEFIEIANTSGANHTVDASGTGTGYSLAASDGIVRCSIPDGTVIPNRGHYLCVNSAGYSLGAYPAGNGTTATGDATYTLDIPSNAGIALFSTNVPAEFALATRLDAVGPSSEANTLYKEGTGYFPLAFPQPNPAFYRDNCGKGGSTLTFGPCPSAGNLVDTNNNVNDFINIGTDGVIDSPFKSPGVSAAVAPAGDAGLDQRIGAPGPENLSSPIQRNDVFSVTLLDPCVASQMAPNRVRIPAAPGAFDYGTMEIRRTITNSTGASVTRLRFRIIDITIFRIHGSGIADLRAISSSDTVATVDRAPCGSGTSDITVRGTTLEQPPTQPIGGGFNSSWSADAITLATPLANGASIDVRLVLRVSVTGAFRFYVNIEALP